MSWVEDARLRPVRLRPIRLRPAGRNRIGRSRTGVCSVSSVFSCFLLFLFLFLFFSFYFSSSSVSHLTLIFFLFGFCFCLQKTFAPKPQTLRWTPFRWTAQNFALCFPSPATIFILSSSLGVFSWNFGGVFEGTECEAPTSFGCPFPSILVRLLGSLNRMEGVELLLQLGHFFRVANHFRSGGCKSAVA